MSIWIDSNLVSLDVRSMEKQMDDEKEFAETSLVIEQRRLQRTMYESLFIFKSLKHIYDSMFLFELRKNLYLYFRTIWLELNVLDLKFGNFFHYKMNK